MKILLKNGHLLDPAADIDEPMDVLVDDGKIARIEKTIKASADETLDMKGLVVCPGFIDMHVHLREPGQEWKETVASGTAAAARGGFTSVACMANTVPVNDTRSVTQLIVKQAAQHGAVNVFPIGCVTKGMEGEQLAEMGDMLDAGAVAFSDDGKPVHSSMMMRKALEYSQVFGVPIIDHCEDPVLVDGGVMNEGELSTRLGLGGWPAVAEDIMVVRDIILAEYTGGHVHIAHTSTGQAVDFVREGKKKKVRVTCEVTPHHFVLTEEAVSGFDTDAKMNPPLRSAKDRKALLQGLADGTVDAIATDHAPHHCDEKCVEFSVAPFGVVGLETAIPLSLHHLVHADVLPLRRMVELFTRGPAEILRLDRGTLTPGGVADITVLDIHRPFHVAPQEFVSKGRNTPFKGWDLTGAAVLTIVSGRVVHDGRSAGD
ncbi:MAG: dihydroorotase [Acidobacteriota bacterium]|nr:dihydroorotase [Acidobacteriota bacterium]